MKWTAKNIALCAVLAAKDVVSVKSLDDLGEKHRLADYIG